MGRLYQQFVLLFFIDLEEHIELLGWSDVANLLARGGNR